jgi:hypothetical protein
MPGLTAQQLEQFDREGYLVVNDVLDPQADIQPVLDEYNSVLDGIVDGLIADGLLRERYDHLPFPERLTQVSMESGRNFPSHFDISLPQKGVKYDSPMHHGPAVFRLLTNPKLLDVVESVVGPEIYSNPVQHIRTKLPKKAIGESFRHHGLLEKIDWHQDNGVILAEADESQILTVWLALLDATLDNGCMQVIPKSHQQGITDHCPSDNGLRIPAKILPLEQAVPLPMRAGSILLMTQRTVHSSLDNVTEDSVRISLDLRYQRTGVPTGRPTFPGFVARSRTRPEQALADPAIWKKLWLDARETLARAEDPVYNRWDGTAPACA